MASMQKKLRDETVDSSVFGTEEATAKLMMGFERPEGEKLFTLSDVTPTEIFGLNLIMNYGDKLYSKVTDGWVRNHLLLRISRLRIGRKEDILLMTGIVERSEKKGKGKLQDLFSGLKG